MKVKIEQSIAGHEFAYAPGDIAELEPELASAWIESGVASRIAPTVKTKEFAVPAKAETPEKPKTETVA